MQYIWSLINKFLGAQNDFSLKDRLHDCGDPKQISDLHDQAEVKQKVKCNTASPWNNIPALTFTLQEEFKAQRFSNTQQSDHGDDVAYEYVQWPSFLFKYKEKYLKRKL
jgi:hypothetical protein